MRFLEKVQLLILAAMLGLILFGVYVAVQVQTETREHYRITQETENKLIGILEGRSACVIPEQTIKEVIEDDPSKIGR